MKPKHLRFVFALGCFVLLLSGVVFAAERPDDIQSKRSSRVDYEVSAGDVSLIFTGINVNDIEDIRLNGESIRDRLVNPGETQLEYTVDGFIAHFGRALAIEDAATLEVTLKNGERRVLEP